MNRYAKVAKCVALSTIVVASVAARPSGAAPISAVKNAMDKRVDVIQKVVIEAGPYDLHRRYLSMQGPFADTFFCVGDLVTHHLIKIPESKICFVEDGTTPYMMSSSSSHGGMQGSGYKGSYENYGFAGNTRSSQSRQLYWYRGVQVDTIDEKGQVLPTPEFICHVNLYTDPSQHNANFPTSSHFSRPMITCISQGYMRMILPEGFGVPLASDEQLWLTMQAANRTTDKHRRIKLRCTIFLEKDEDSVKPMRALNVMEPYVAVITDHDSHGHKGYDQCDACVATSNGESAPNGGSQSLFRNPQGQMMNGHWVVPPGIHKYVEAIEPYRDPEFAVCGPIRAAWIHVHPYCQSLSLVEYNNRKKKVLYTAYCRTKTSPGVQITHLDYITAPQGIALNPGAKYALEVVYNNTSGKPVDSMAATGIYFSDLKFKLPDWAKRNERFKS